MTIQVKTFVGTDQFSEPKFPEQAGGMGEIAHKLMTAEQHLDKQVNEWYKENNITSEDQIKETLFKVLVGARVVFVYHIRYDDGTEGSSK